MLNVPIAGDRDPAGGAGSGGGMSGERMEQVIQLGAFFWPGRGRSRAEPPCATAVANPAEGAEEFILYLRNKSCTRRVVMLYCIRSVHREERFHEAS